MERPLAPDALEVVMGNGGERGVVTGTALGNAYFALEDETPLSIGQKTRTYGAQLVGINQHHSVGLRLRAKLREGTRLWMDPASEAEATATRTHVLAACEKVLNALKRHKYYFVFEHPVDPVALGIPDYPDVIKDPMDLGTVGDKLARGGYLHPREFEYDCRLTFQNCKTYNSPGTDAHSMGDAMLKEFEKNWLNMGFC